MDESNKELHKFYHFIWFNHDDGSVQYDMVRVDPNDIGPSKPYDCPIELEYIPNNMGINLCSVKRITWNRLGDGQLVDLKIEFEPNLEHPEGVIECTIDTSADVIHETFMDGYKNNHVMYFLSESNMDGKTLEPRVPNNFLTKNGYEDNKTPRVCFSNSINGALAALSQNLKDKTLYVHQPDGQYDVYTPSKSEVPDVGITHELWVKEPVKIKCIGSIKVGEAKEPGKKYKYGDDKEAELYYWNYEEIDKISEASVLKDNYLEYNMDKFPNQSNMLFITGLSGSGKSSIAAKFAKKYDAVNIEIDLLEHNDIIFDKNTTNDEGNLVIKDYMEKYHHGAYKFKISNNEKAWAKEVERFLKYCIDIAKKNKDKIYILEGIQLMDIPDSIDIIKPYPIIVVNTSMIKSMWRAYKREECGFLEYMKSFKSIAGLKEYIDWYLAMEKQKNDFKKKLKESVVIPESPFSEAYATLSSFLIDHIEDNPRFKSILSETAENDPIVKTNVDTEKKSISNGLVKDPSDKPSDLDLLKEDE